MDLEVTKDINKTDINDILSCWMWLVSDVQSVIIVSCLGDIFLTRNDGAVYWLQTDCGVLTKVADNLDAFQQFLNDGDKVDDWFLPELVKRLIQGGKILKENEVYSYKVPPALGGEYSVENIEPTDISVHFAFNGQIYEQIKDLPEGTKVNITLKK